MKVLFKPRGRFLALFMFLPITPSIPAITVFIQSVLIERNYEVSIIPSECSMQVEIK